MSEHKVFLRNPDVALREEDAEGSLLFNPDTGQVLVINDTGRFIWDLCESDISISAIATEFEDEYTDLPDSILEDIQEYIETMTKGGFIASR